MIKTTFNVTNISYSLLFIKNGELEQEFVTETLLHKRTDKNIRNYLNKVVDEKGANGFNIVSVEVEKVTCSIPHDVALLYKK